MQLDYPVPPRCPKCNAVSIRLLSSSLALLIEKHELPEVLDRLESLTHEQSQLPQNQKNQEIEKEWRQLLDLLDLSRHQAIRLANLVHSEGRGLWG